MLRALFGAPQRARAHAHGMREQPLVEWAPWASRWLWLGAQSRARTCLRSHSCSRALRLRMCASRRRGRRGRGAAGCCTCSMARVRSSPRTPPRQMVPGSSTDARGADGNRGPTPPKAGGSTLSMLFKRLDVLGKGAYATHDCPGWDSVVDAAVRASAEATVREAPLRIVYEVHRTAKMVSPTFADLEAGVARLRDAGVRVVVAGLFRDPVRFFWSNFWDGHRHSWLKPLTDALGLCDALQKRPPGAPLPTFMCDDAPWEWSPTDRRRSSLPFGWPRGLRRCPRPGSSQQSSTPTDEAAPARRRSMRSAVAHGAPSTRGGAGWKLDLLTVMTEQRYEGPTLRHAARLGPN